MRTDAGFVHAWTLPAELSEDVWRPLHADLILVLRMASAELERHRSDEALAVLRGPEGLGRLVLDADVISFNGNAFLGQAGDAFSLERKARQGVISRMTRHGSRLTVRRCDTRGQPYDLAVCALLLVVLKHFGDSMRVGTSATLRDGWGRAAALVRTTLGDCGQLVQVESGLLRWVDAPPAGLRGRVSSSAS
ncbi:MAG: hypothetical protein V4550_19715 [Gemmatimonadota bacterium]